MAVTLSILLIFKTVIPFLKALDKFYILSSLILGIRHELRTL